MHEMDHLPLLYHSAGVSLWQPFDVPRVICAHIAAPSGLHSGSLIGLKCYFYSECTRLAQVLRTGVPDQ